MQLIVANPTGFCFGVRRAIKAMEDALKEHGIVYSMGSPIHNPQEVDRLEKKGLRVVNEPEEIPSGSPVFIRAHGVSPQVSKELRRRSTKIVDGTCPFVRKAQKRASLLSEEGYGVVIVGNENHPEVRGIRGYVSTSSWVVNDVEKLSAIDKIDRIGIISQTTQEERNLASVVSQCLLRSNELRVFNTICKATVERQEAIRHLADRVDGIIVIGGHNSANTGKLYDIARSAGTPSIWIEHVGQLDRNWLTGRSRIGIAAGASTPDWLINQLKLAVEKS